MTQLGQASIDWNDRQALARGREGLYCISNITYSDGRWERPYYTMDQERARRYLEWLAQGGWRGMCFEKFENGEWVDWADRILVEGEGHTQTVTIREERG